MESDGFWQTAWIVWKVFLVALVAVGLIVIVSIWFPDSSSVIFSGVLATVTVYLYQKSSREGLSTDEIGVSYVTSLGGSIGGKLEIQDEALVFTPSKLEKVFRRKSFQIPYEDIESIETLPRFDDGVVAIIRKNGLSNRIEIVLEDETRELFTTSNFDDHVEKLRKAIEDN